MDKPKDIKEYTKWLDGIQSDYNCKKFQKYYENVMYSAKAQFLESEFWRTLQSKWDIINADYYAKTGYSLFAEKLTNIYIKPYESVIDKTYRKNIVQNENWPDPPKKIGEWILLGNCLSIINDCLRTTIVVKYLDGAEFILKNIEEIAKNIGINTHYDFEAKDEGYYAIHEYLVINFEIPDMKWDTKKIEMKVEIQITTQIQDTIKKLTHQYYEKRRIDTSTVSKKWQWNYLDDSFTVNYLGHILHYLEGMIMEIRDKKE